MDTKACANTELNRCLAEQTRRYDDTAYKRKEASLSWVAGVDGDPAG